MSIRPSVCSFVCNANRNIYSSFLINSEIMIRISGKKLGILSKKTQPYIQNNIYIFNFKVNFLKIRLNYYSFVVDGWVIYLAYLIKGTSAKKLKWNFRNIIFENFQTEILKILHFLLLFRYWRSNDNWNSRGKRLIFLWYLYFFGFLKQKN